MNILVYGPIVYDVFGEQAFLGGYSTNVAAHCALLGLHPYLVSGVGNDFNGKNALKQLREYGVQTEYVKIDPFHATGVTEILLDDASDPRYLVHTDTAYDHITVAPDALKTMAQQSYDAFYFGTVEQRSPESADTLYFLLDTLTIRYRFCDLNLRKDCFSKQSVVKSLHHCDILKINQDELCYLREQILNQNYSEPDTVTAIKAQYGPQLVLVTKGERGVTVYTSTETADIPAYPVQVVDTVGSGDGFTAAFLSHFLSGDSPMQAAKKGNYLGGCVAASRSAIPAYTLEMKQELMLCPHSL